MHVPRFLHGFVDRRRAVAAARKDRSLHRALAEKQQREARDGSIWRTGKGGAHHDH